MESIYTKLGREETITILFSSVTEIMITKMKGKIQEKASKPDMILKKISAFLLKECMPTLSIFSF